MPPRYEFTDKSEGYMKKFLIHDRKLGDAKDIIAVTYELDVAERITRLLNQNDFHRR